MFEINNSERLSELELNLGEDLADQIKKGIDKIDKYILVGAVLGSMAGMVGFGYFFNRYEPLQDFLPYPTLGGIGFGLCFANPGAFNGHAYGISKIRKLKKIHPKLADDIEEYLKLNLELKNKKSD
ncbi:hypothetical protein HYV49_00220 [Candidatus Pacearchaeota archaeon]|nr:hypothetical protein [Candidatus Pacearchaeota archaeon]